MEIIYNLKKATKTWTNPCRYALPCKKKLCYIPERKKYKQKQSSKYKIIKNRLLNKWRKKLKK